MYSWKISKNNIFEEETPTPEINDNEVKVRVSFASISKSDIQLIDKQDNPIIPSRVAVGYIGNDDATIPLGTKVLLSPYTESENPIENKKFITHGIDCDGYLCDYVIANTTDVYPIPSTMQDKDAYFIEYVGLACAVIDKINIEKGTYVVLFGANRLAITIAQLLSYYQAIPIVIDNDKDRLDFAQQQNIDYIIDSTSTNLYERLYSLTSGNLADYVIYTFSKNTQLEDAVAICKNDGEIIFASINISEVKSDMTISAQDLVKKNISISCITNAYGNIPAAINAIATGMVDVSSYPVEEIKWKDVKDFFLSKNHKNNIKYVVNCDKSFT